MPTAETIDIGNYIDQSLAARALVMKYLSYKTYDGQPYYSHNDALKTEAIKFGLDPAQNAVLYVAIELHDLFEDTKAVTREELLAEVRSHGISERAIALALAVTDPPGFNRRMKKALLYERLRKETDPQAIELKLLDRLANVRNGKKLQMYKQEHAAFKARLKKDDASPTVNAMWAELETLLTPYDETCPSPPLTQENSTCDLPYTY